ncbi:LON peptidase substrate-binding domain-containing protein [uncultured Eudoraea sp.]|uniref:LON peptidase substrate-binding domain-containing protein n=1 Tax=uncultured Eudoraea sp. TaxID=1035614 RepID=UPI002607255A|nr:LON peptidase substrate-binding domain-containing protein [uncultured Eudoraea sp.]
MKLPFFPLQSVFFPGEKVPLHIFEDRYKQLINDCRKEAITFGIPVYINDSIAYGTEVQLMEVVNTYESGAMDVVCVARQVFRVISFDNTMDGRLYAGGEVEFIDNIKDSELSAKQEVYSKLKDLYELMEVPFAPVELEMFNSYTLAHKMGLSFEQEYELLQLASENERLKFIMKHLSVTIQVLNEVNRTKLLIELNGHFKNFDPLDFKAFKI